ncbi:hypothetical protein D3C71_1721070 [compost metagenome]
MNVTLNGLLLPDDLIWRDEFDWAPVEQVVTPTLTGALLVEETDKPEGRPITLVGHCPRATVLSIAPGRPCCRSRCWRPRWPSS